MIVGSGVAGLSAALALLPRPVTLITTSQPGVGGSSRVAQGGIAAAVGPGDSPLLHAIDTVRAGAGLVDRAMARLLTSEGPRQIERLIGIGVRFDRADGVPHLGREGAHGMRRILHAGGDNTGAELVRALGRAAAATPSLRIVSRTTVLELVLRDGHVRGVLARRPDDTLALYPAGAVLLATGGIGRLFRHTTNPAEATGAGLAMAGRAGAALVDLEFVQFHPTALAVAGADPMPLVSEAVRGEGAVLLDETGARLPIDDPRGELAPRDVVARAIWTRRRARGAAYLDASALGERFADRFPTVFSQCMEHGIDPRRAPIPVSPAAHYHMGGVAVDARGRTTLPGLWACGEVAATGVHGANRLASNSLLEALVWGERAGMDLREIADAAPPQVELRGAVDEIPIEHEEVVERVRDLSWEHLGVVRDGIGLRAAARQLDEMPSHHLVELGRWIAAAALVRTESRGAHTRADHPRRDPRLRRRLFVNVLAQNPTVSMT